MHESFSNVERTSATGDRAAVEAASKQAIVLCKNDVASQLGIIITFSDNDGD